jgi:alcohol dehydrogenase
LKTGPIRRLVYRRVDVVLKQVLDGSFDPGEVFDATFDLDPIAEAYAAMDVRRAIKALVRVSELS